MLTYPDVLAAVAWLTETLGFTERVRIGPGHRAQLSFGEGWLIVADTGGDRQAPSAGGISHLWTLTQTLRDVAPEEWGGTTS